MYGWIHYPCYFFLISFYKPAGLQYVTGHTQTMDIDHLLYWTFILRCDVISGHLGKIDPLCNTFRNLKEWTEMYLFSYLFFYMSRQGFRCTTLMLNTFTLAFSICKVESFSTGERGCSCSTTILKPVRVRRKFSLWVHFLLSLALCHQRWCHSGRAVFEPTVCVCDS